MYHYEEKKFTELLKKKAIVESDKLLVIMHDPIRRESSMEPKKEGNEEERSLLSTRSPARLRSHPSRARQPPKWLLDYDQN
ncbi:hypothetical protein ILUMI_07254 [Ignelater luminosus]|uniref:Uncharacterized protein n=1 Tax=Ignelater luminosus TaxID=2038154 RepID=A0A8K0D8G3_IGNLU|nr:hypothetical protein ILUMI_07254 [Ignelater luminosus]